MSIGNPWEVPHTWSWSSIGEITDYVQRGKSPKYAIHSNLPVINQKCIRWHGVEPEHFKFVDPSQWSAWGEERHVRVGDILWNSTGTGTIGRAAIFQPLDGIDRVVVDSHVTILRTQSIEPRFLFFWIRSARVQGQIEEMQSGSTNQVELGRAQVLATEVPIAPLPEQRRIVAKIEALMARSRKARVALTPLPALLERYRQSVLAAAFAGELTAEWRQVNRAHCLHGIDLASRLARTHEVAGGHRRGNAAEPTEGVHDLHEGVLPDGWGIADLRELVEPDRPITYGILMPGPEFPGGVLYVRVADMGQEEIRLDGIRRTTPEIDSSFARARLREGDILLSIRGTVGRVALVPKELEGANITQDTARLSIQPLMNASYVAWFLRSLSTQRRMQAATKGVAVRGINIGDVRAIQVPIPALAEQAEIVRILEALFHRRDEVEFAVSMIGKSLQSLDRSILTKAFRGELVAQDPSDEPAEVLLARIRGQKPTGKPALKQGRPLKGV